MSLKISLMPHQKEAIDKLKTGSILCGGVGTGKSMTALAYYYIFVCRGTLWNGDILGQMMDPRPLYIITTARKRDTKEWEKEMERFGLQKGGENEVECVIDSWNNLYKYSNVYGAFFILDEQRVVGRGQWVKAFYKIAKKNQWILLSATPGDTWLDYIPVFVANGFYRNRSAFLQEHAVFNPYITKFPKIDRWTDVGKLEKFRRKITVNMEYDRNTTRHWKTIEVGYDKEKYEMIAKKRWNPWKNEPIQDISEACQLLRRASSSGIVEGSSDYSPFVVNARASEIYHLCTKKHPKLIVFYNYDYELDAMKETFRILQDEVRLYSGMKRFAVAEWNGHKHEPLPSGDRWIYLVQYAAGCEGWNCVETDAIAFYSQSYSYKQMEQAAGRIDRLNTPYKDLYYYVLKSSAPIDGAIARTLKDKKTFNEKRYWAEMDREDIRRKK